MNTMLKTLAALAVLGVASTSASAHHFVNFVPDKEVTLSGTVKDFQFTNPHSSIQLTVPGKGEWSVETASPVVLKKAGIDPMTIHKGDQVTVHAHPLKDNKRAAWLIDVRKADGTILSVPQPHMS